MNSIQFIQDADMGIAVMHNVGTWMEENGMMPNQWWKPENMNREFLLQHTEPEEYFVAVVDNKPAASMILQETERNQSWKPIDGDDPKKALYVHWLCVHRDFAGQGLPSALIDYAEKAAQKRGYTLLRLDTSADETKLCQMYEALGFTLMGTEKEDGHTTAYYQKSLLR